MKTMQTIVGDESLQFRFVDNASSTRKELAHKFVYNSEKRQFVAPEQMLEHLTLGIKTLTNSRDNEAHKFWRVGRFESAVLDDAKKRYFVYISAPDVANGQVGAASVELSETARPLKEGSRYNLLVGTLNSENSGTRSFAPMFGFTEILPSRITTDRLVASDGRSFFDMASASMKLGNALDFNTKGDGKLRLNGTLVQNEGGVSALIGIFRGAWNVGYTYYEGDEVTHTTPEGALVTYRYIYPQPSRGVTPTNTTFWQPVSRGADGTNGSTSYLHIKYSNDGGSTFTAPNGETVGDYIGQCTDFNKTAPSSPSAYKWSKTKGEQGIPGKNGAEGLTPMPNLLKCADLNPKAVSTDTKKNKEFAWQAYKSEDGVISHEPDIVPPHAGAKVVSCESFKRSTYWRDNVKSYANIFQVLRLTAGVTYTFSVYVKGADAGWLVAWPIDGTEFKISGAQPIDEGNNTVEGWKRYAVTFTARSSGNTNLHLACRSRNKDEAGGKVFFACPKMEESYKPTPWTRAQEDFRTDYTELRFAVNGSRTTPPEIKIKERTPYGWTAEQPAVRDLQYLWMTSARISGATDALLTDWSKPTRISAADGAKGDSPALTFRGAYDSSKTYYGTSHRVDAVKIGNEYYVARTDAGEFRNVAPPDASKWNDFGANFESVATNLLLAEKANIGDWFLSGGKIVSTLDEQANKIELDAKSAEIKVTAKGVSSENEVGQPDGTREATINANRAIVEVRNPATQDVAQISSKGIFANNAETRAHAPSVGESHLQGAIVAVAKNGNVNYDVNPFNGQRLPFRQGQYGVIGIYGRAQNKGGNVPTYGGYFENLHARGLSVSTKHIDRNASDEISETDTFVFCSATVDNGNEIRMPKATRHGQTIIVRTGDIYAYVNLVAAEGQAFFWPGRRGNKANTTCSIRANTMVFFTAMFFRYEIGDKTYGDGLWMVTEVSVL